MALNDYKFLIAKQTDGTLYDSLLKLARDSPWSGQSIVVHVSVTGGSVASKIADAETNAKVAELMDPGDGGLCNFTLQFTDSLVLVVERQDDVWSDQVSVRIDQNHFRQKFSDIDALRFAKMSRDYLREIKPARAFLSHLDEQSKQFYAAREETVVRLERLQAEFMAGLRESAARMHAGVRQ
ncbi:MAG TPA: hypothetical protein VG406_04395 [Isosphaeraceae bacterium]|jgi:hypothetical protein|nr:hypothetical protein [Isosphaeraceae bacterium]